MCRRLATLTRRGFLGNSLRISTGLALAQRAFSLADTLPLLTLSLAKSDRVSVPGNFIGLGYEMSSVAFLGLLSAANHPYVELIKRLGPQGVLRVGGQDDGHGLNSAGAPYYGMLAFSFAKRGCSEAMMVQMPESAHDITAYALGTGGKVLCTILINHDGPPQTDTIQKLAEEWRGMNEDPFVHPTQKYDDMLPPHTSYFDTVVPQMP